MTPHRPALWRPLAAALPLALAACATHTPPQPFAADPPAEWQAPLPHNGSVTDLTTWWQQQSDGLLAQLIEAAQAANPNVASARSRIAQARAAQTSAEAALKPTVDGSLSGSRGITQPIIPLGTTLQATVQASWEVDLFGGNRAALEAARARLGGAQAAWHDARVSVAAEVANQYVSLRSCQRQLAVMQADAASRTETARLTELAAQAGFQAPAFSALARASAAEGSARVTQQRAQCDLDIKALVALTALSEPALRQRLAEAQAKFVAFSSIAISSVPAQLLAQRPDLYTAEQEVAAASADLGQTQAQRYPRLGLSGSVGRLDFRSASLDGNITTWSVGPITLSVPILDGGRRAANIAAAQARYEEAAATYRARARQAVREVEEALVNLQSTAARNEDALVATEGYRASFLATESRYRGGLASLVELEDARRTALSAELALLSLQRERQVSWIALYRAAGGGWASPATEPSRTASQASSP